MLGQGIDAGLPTRILLEGGGKTEWFTEYRFRRLIHQGAKSEETAWGGTRGERDADK